MHTHRSKQCGCRFALFCAVLLRRASSSALRFQCRRFQDRHTTGLGITPQRPAGHRDFCRCSEQATATVFCAMAWAASIHSRLLAPQYRLMSSLTFSRDGKPASLQWVSASPGRGRRRLYTVRRQSIRHPGSGGLEPPLQCLPRNLGLG